MTRHPAAADLKELQILPEFTSFASELADAARRETLARWSSPGTVEDKGGPGGFDPVTEADREAERAMRRIIEQAYPDHGIAGEELPEKRLGGRFSWSLDPIDGTRSFTCGLPTWTTLIALIEDGAPILGIIDAPRLDERYIGAGGRSWIEDGAGERPLRASGCTALSGARLSTTDPYLFAGAAAKGFEDLRSSVLTTRFGHDAYAYARLAAGSIDLVVESGLKPHDYNALIPLVRGAGGVFGDWLGGSDYSAGQVIAAATPDLFESAVAIMRGAAAAVP